MSNQPQASVRKSTAWTPPAGSLSAVGGGPPPPLFRSTLQREGARNCSVGVCRWPRVSSPLVTQLCIRVRELPHKQQTPSRWTGLSFWCPCPVSVEAFFTIQMTVRTYLVYTMIPFWKLEASNWDDSAEQKWVRVMTIAVFFLGRKCGLWVLCVNVLWETSKERPSQFGIFKECSSPQKGHSLKFELAFVKTLYKLGKLIEVRKRSEKDKNAKTPAKQKPRKKVFVCLLVCFLPI